jgi:hypothetical protein
MHQDEKRDLQDKGAERTVAATTIKARIEKY